MASILNTLSIIIFAFLLFGCTTSELPFANNSTSSNISSNISTNLSANVSVNPIVVFETTKGTFKAEIFEKEAPITSRNFLSLARSGFYDNLTFHRYAQDFVIQGGDPNGDGSGGSGKKISLEIVPSLTHGLGALGMARTNDPNSATSQFYVVIGQAHFLDGQYAVFGNVTDGMDVVMQLRKGDKMIRVYEE